MLYLPVHCVYTGEMPKVLHILKPVQFNSLPSRKRLQNKYLTHLIWPVSLAQRRRLLIHILTVVSSLVQSFTRGVCRRAPGPYLAHCQVLVLEHSHCHSVPVSSMAPCALQPLSSGTVTETI